MKKKSEETVLNYLTDEMSLELEIEKNAKTVEWDKIDMKIDVVEKESLDCLIDGMHSALKMEREEILNLMDVIHSWESIFLSLNLQTNKEINHESMSAAFRFAERCCGDTLESMYKKQSSVSGDALDFSSIQRDIEKRNYKEVH
tara:strand:+ start:217 stop:648 length:432 start_codon:yes stop_codon:yes gene_type:complete